MLKPSSPYHSELDGLPTTSNDTEEYGHQAGNERATVLLLLVIDYAYIKKAPAS